MAADTPNENRTPELELRYFGRVLAGQCHELVNALNIVNELCGLHDDILPRALEGNAGAVKKLGNFTQRMHTQLARCHALLRVLSRFAHAVDEAGEPCDACEIVQRAVFLGARQARLRQTELEAVVPQDGALMVDYDPFRLQQAIHEGIELLLEDATRGGRITAKLTADPSGAVVTLERADPPAAGKAEDGGRLVLHIPYGRRDLASGGTGGGG